MRLSHVCQIEVRKNEGGKSRVLQKLQASQLAVERRLKELKCNQIKIKATGSKLVRGTTRLSRLSTTSHMLLIEKNK